MIFLGVFFCNSFGAEVMVKKNVIPGYELKALQKKVFSLFTWDSEQYKGSMETGDVTDHCALYVELALAKAGGVVMVLFVSCMCFSSVSP